MREATRAAIGIRVRASICIGVSVNTPVAAGVSVRIVAAHDGPREVARKAVAAVAGAFTA